MGHRMGKTRDPKRFSWRYRRDKVLIRNNTVTQVFGIGLLFAVALIFSVVFRDYFCLQ